MTTLVPHPEAMIRLHLVECCVALFQDYGSAMQATPEPSTVHDLAGIIGFTGAHIGGTLSLVSSSSLLARTRPTAPVNTAEVEDWAAELANQLLGRLKNRLLQHNVQIQLSTPVAVAGRHLELRTLSTPLYFHSELGRLAVWFDVRFDEDFVAEQIQEGQSVAEGELELF